MVRRTQGYIIGVITTVLLFYGVAMAASRTETINVTYRNIRIVIDGEVFIPMDVNDNIVEPFLYNGTTYLPVRAVSQALDRDVDWDGATSTVFIDSRTSEKPDSGQSVITQILNSIESREVIDEARISTISNDEEVYGMLNEYNMMTNFFHSYFFVVGTRTIGAVTVDGFGFDEGLSFFSGEWNTPPHYPFTPEMIAEAALRIAKHATYRDATQRIYNDIWFSPLLEKEAGGSAGMWPDYIHDFHHNTELAKILEEYFILIENVIDSLETLNG